MGRLFGIPLRLHITWFIIFALVTVSLAESQFPSQFPQWSPALNWGIGLATSLLFFASVVAHELGHSLVARRYGITVKSITLFVFGGVAQIARDASKPAAEGIIAFVGPLTSVVLGGLFLGLYFWLRHINEPIAALGLWLGRINLVLAVFNLIPGFPLDGGRVFRAIVWGINGNFLRASRIASIVGRGIGYLLMAGGVFWAFRYDLISGLWMAFIGWFLENAASSSYSQLALRGALDGHEAREMMTQECPTIEPGIDLRSLVDRFVIPGGRRCFVVMDGVGVLGLLTLADVKSVPQKKWDRTTVQQVMTPLSKLRSVGPDEAATRVLEIMDESGVSQVPVIQDGRVLGLIGRDNLARFIRARAELGV